ncbi:hypothetical protein B0H13DRAFT_2097391 [Mycena leptocephala]|nr:hypothetical protein B0H13DRAFT_2097391 [Mycena leptocephala]
MNSDGIADPGYESDTGARDNPTCANFEANEPVTQIFGFVPGKKALNRKGRAICRIMAAHDWPHKAIADIFRVSEQSVNRAVQNVFYSPPRDRIEEDYDRAPDFRGVHLPQPPERPVAPPKARGVFHIDLSDDEDDYDALDAESSSNGRLQRAAKLQCKSRIRKVADDEDNEAVEPSQWRSHEGAPASPESLGPPAKRPRYSYDLADSRHQSEESMPSPFRFPSQASSSSSAQVNIPTSPSFAPFQAQGSSLRSVLPWAVPNRPLPLPLPPDLSLFLKNWTDVDFFAHSELLKAQGFDVPRLHTLATWHREEQEEALTRLLIGSGAAAVGRPGMTAVTFIKFEIALRGLKCTPPVQAPLPRSLLPPPSSNTTNSGTTLPVFLRNVMGLDLSAHHRLLEEQGIDIAALSGMPAWEHGDLQEVLKRSLLEPGTEADRMRSLVPNGSGMKALEMLALEFCIRRAGAKAIM